MTTTRHAAAAVIITLALCTPAHAQQAPAGQEPTHVDYTYPTNGYWLSRLIGGWTALMGRELNGTTLNGAQLNGRMVTGVSLQGIKVKGKTLKKAALWGSRFFPLLGKGWFKGAEVTATLDDGAKVSLVVKGAARGTLKQNKDIYYYDVYYQTKGGQNPLCGLDDNGAPVPAIALRGRWDYRQGVSGGGDYIPDKDSFTFGCVGHALAKCAEDGYKPWRSMLVCAKGKGCKKVSLAKHHQACTRMMRADYCGDGSSHTKDNIDVSLYDGLGVRTDSEKWPFEAEWDAGGAVCADTSRVANPNLTCAAQLVDSSCGAPKNFAAGTLLFSEVPAP